MTRAGLWSRIPEGGRHPSLPFDREPSARQPELVPPRSLGAPAEGEPQPQSAAPHQGLHWSAPVPVFARHPHARRYVVRVRADGSVRVTIPRWGSKREAMAFADQQRDWIAKQIRRVAQDRVAPRVEVPVEQQRVLLARAKSELPARLLALAAQLGLTVARVTVRNQRWRWGSCSRSGHISLNWRLVAMPDWVRDYVLAHELMHLKRMDHSPTFWKLVADTCPGFADARAWLRVHQNMLAP